MASSLASTSRLLLASGPASSSRGSGLPIRSRVQNIPQCTSCAVTRPALLPFTRNASSEASTSAPGQDTSSSTSPARLHRGSRPGSSSTSESSLSGASLAGGESLGDIGSNAKTGNEARSAGSNAAFAVPDSSVSARERTSQSKAKEADRAQGLASSTSPSASSAAAPLEKSSVVRLPSDSVSASSVPSAATKPGYDIDSLPKPMNELFSTIIGLLQKEGKKAKAMRQLSDVLQHLTAAANGSPLPILTAAVERASPLVRMRSRKQGGKNIQVPLPLSERQATRRGITAILEASKKRSDAELSVRLAKEILAVVEGTSNTLQRKEEAHKIALINRANASVRI